MPTVREFFLSEATGYLERLRAAIEGGAGRPVDAGLLQRLARGLRGSAQMAQSEPVREAALVLEAAARALASGAVAWNADTGRRVAETIDDLRALVQGGEGASQQEVRVASVRERWAGRGVRPGQPGQAADGATADAGFREFAAREVGAIANELDAAFPILARTPMDREPLKAVLRRQRALAGAARLSDLPAIAETVQAIDDVTRLLARLNAPASGEWVEFYRAAREVFTAAAAALQGGQTPAAAAPGLGRMRALRDGLLERSGGEPAASPAPVAEPEALPIENFLYSGDAALERALELRETIEAAVGSDARARAAVDEVFDLIRLARS